MFKNYRQQCKHTAFKTLQYETALLTVSKGCKTYLMKDQARSNRRIDGGKILTTCTLQGHLQHKGFSRHTDSVQRKQLPQIHCPSQFYYGGTIYSPRPAACYGDWRSLKISSPGLTRNMCRWRGEGEHFRIAFRALQSMHCYDCCSAESLFFFFISWFGFHD